MERARLAVDGDVAAIELVADVVRRQTLAGRGGELFLAVEGAGEPLGDQMRAAISAPNHMAVVGSYDDVVFGYSLVTVELTASDALIARLRHFAVEPEARAVGIGEAMMNLIIEQATALGCEGVDSWALPGDRSTKNFFESFGLKARLLTVHRKLQS